MIATYLQTPGRRQLREGKRGLLGAPVIVGEPRTAVCPKPALYCPKLAPYCIIPLAVGPLVPVRSLQKCQKN